MAADRDCNRTGSGDAKNTGGERGPDLTDINWDGHGRFRELCIAYADYYRPIFLKEFINQFVRRATKPELATLRKEVAAHERRIRVQKGKSKGRPRAEDDWTWLRNARDAAFKRFVEVLSWKKVAESEGKKPNKPNIRTLKNRQDRYAGIIWEACCEVGIWQSGSGTEADIDRLRHGLETTSLRVALCRRALLPFNIFPGQDLTAECKKVVMTLAPQGGKVVGKQLVREINLSKQRKRGHSRSVK